MKLTAYERTELLLTGYIKDERSLKMAALELSGVIREYANEGFDEGYSFAKEESGLVTEASKVLGK